MTTGNNILVKAENLKKFFPVKGVFWRKHSRYVYAVNDISFDIYEGETLGLVGESGCGKTTTGKLLLALMPVTDGEILFRNTNLCTLATSDARKIRAKIQIIFQDPYSSLNPRKTVRQILEEPLNIHKIGDAIFRKKRVLQLLNLVGLLPESMERYPHEFSGGQRQRIGVARAIAVNPEFVVCDEPVSALDVSIQAQILNLLEDLQREFNLTYLFIAHDFTVVRHISHRISVMYLGKIVELTESDEIYHNPLHPYTQALLSAVPIADPMKTRARKRIILEGDVPSPMHPPEGCIFSERCPIVSEACLQAHPTLLDYGTDLEHWAACFKIDK